MDTNDQATHDVPAEVPDQEEKTLKTWGRRELLKALAATGGAVALANVPNKWNKPEVGFGVLPAHAQASVVAPPPPPVNPITHAITTSNSQNATGATTISPTDTISTFCIITPNTAGIQMRRRIILNQPGHALNGQDINNVTGPTDATGQYTPSNFDLSTVPGITTGTDRITVRWEFVNPSDGTNVHVNLLTLA